MTECDFDRLITETLQNEHSNDKLGDLFTQSLIQSLSWLKGNRNTRVAGVWASKIASLCHEQVVECLEFIFKTIAAADLAEEKLFSLVPLLLNRLDSPQIEVIVTHKNCANVRGNVWVSSLVSHLCDLRWNPSNAVFICEALRDHIIGSQPISSKVLNSLLDLFSDVPDEQKPAIINLIVMISRHANCKHVLCLINDKISLWAHSFTNKEQRTAMYALQAQFLIQIQYAIKQDNELCQEFFKTIKKNNTTFKGFNFPLLLCICNIPRFHGVLEQICSIIVNVFKRYHTSLQIHWTTPESFQDVSNAFQSILLKFSSCSSNSWSSIIQSFIRLCVGLVHAFVEKDKSDPLKNLVLSSLLTVFTEHPLERKFMVEYMSGFHEIGQSFHRLFTLDHVISHSSEDTLLEFLCGSGSQIISSLIDQMFQMSPKDAELLIDPLSKCSTLQESLYDKLVMNLRKGAIQKDVAIRKLALHCTISLVRSVSRMKYPFPDHTLKIQSLIGNTGRFLSQQMDIRKCCFQLLLEFGLDFPGNALDILEMTFQRLSQYITNEGATFPINVERSFSANEPMSQMIHTISSLQMSLREDIKSTSLYRDSTEMLARLTFHASKAEISDFGLENTADFEMADNLDRLNYILSIYGACIGHEIILGNQPMVAILFNKQTEFKAPLKGKKISSKQSLAYSIPISLRDVPEVLDRTSSDSECCSLVFNAILNLFSSSNVRNEAILNSIINKLLDLLVRKECGDDCPFAISDKKVLLAGLECLFQAFDLCIKSAPEYSFGENGVETMIKCLRYSLKNPGLFLPKQSLKLIEMCILIKIPELSDRIEEMLRNLTITDISIFKKLLTYFLSHSNDLMVVRSLSREIIHQLGSSSISPDLDQSESIEWLSINDSTICSVVQCMSQYCEDCLVEFDFVMQTGSLSDDIEYVLVERMSQLLLVVIDLASASLPFEMYEHVLKLLTRLYRNLERFVKCELNIQAILENISRLTGLIYTILPILEQQQGESDSKRKKSGNTSSKLTPQLIYNMEVYERRLIDYCRKIKLPVSHYVKKATSRDFRILVNKIEEAERFEEVNKENLKKRPHSPEECSSDE